jgi:hypothetical protein
LSSLLKTLSIYPDKVTHSGIAREVLGSEFNPDLASVAMSLAADPTVLAAIANNDEFQVFH